MFSCVTYMYIQCKYTLRIEIDRAVQGGGLGLGES